MGSPFKHMPMLAQDPLEVGQRRRQAGVSVGIVGMVAAAHLPKALQLSQWRLHTQPVTVAAAAVILSQWPNTLPVPPRLAHVVPQ